jgi:GNAT superfamily N-acetyltransferase
LTDPPEGAGERSASPVVVRSGRVDDVALLGGIEVRAGERFRSVGMDDVADDEPYDDAFYLDALTGGRLWVAELDAEVVGYAVAQDLDGQPHLAQISAGPEAGGRGIGRALVHAVGAWARSVGGTSLTLSTFRAVPWNAPYYAGLGFEPVEDATADPRFRAVRDHEAAEGLDIEARLIMRLRLDPGATPGS